MISRNWEDLWVVTNYNFRTFVKELPTTICQLEIFTVIRISTLQGKPPNSSFLCNLKPMKIVILHVRRTPLNASKLLRLHPSDYHSLNQTWVLVIINHQMFGNIFKSSSDRNMYFLDSAMRSTIYRWNYRLNYVLHICFLIFAKMGKDLFMYFWLVSFGKSLIYLNR